MRKPIVLFAIVAVFGILPLLFPEQYEAIKKANVTGPLTMLVFGVVPVSVFGVRARRARSWKPVKLTIIAGIAGLIGGAVAGCGFRAAMRIAALSLGKVPAFSVGGTLLIIVGTMVLGGAFAVTYLLVRNEISERPYARSLACGLLPFVAEWHGFFEVARGDLRSFSVMTVIVATTLVTCLWFLYGGITETLIQKGEQKFLRDMALH